MITDFASKETEKIWRGDVSRRLPRNIQQVALRKGDDDYGEAK